ncbi:hypothetical protein Hanom_Chr16g01430941 [Helianthus anomalus]
MKQGNRVRSLGILKSLLVHYFKKFSYATNVSILDPFFPFTLWDVTCMIIQTPFKHERNILYP